MTCCHEADQTDGWQGDGVMAPLGPLKSTIATFHQD